MKSFERLIVSASAIVAMGSNLFADDRCCEKEKDPCFEQGYGLPCNKYPAAYNAPACIEVNSCWDFDINFNASFIYWHVQQESMDIAYVDPTQVLAFTSKNAIEFQEAKYKPGFKVGFGINTDYDGWVLKGEYTWLHQTTTKHHHFSTVINLPDWFANTFTVNNAATDAHGRWKSDLDIADGYITRPFYQGEELTISPYAGLRGLWIRENFKITESGPNLVSAVSKNKSHSWAVGPRAGVLGRWLLGWGFRFEGNTAGSLLYTRYTKVTHKESGQLVTSTGTPGAIISNVGGAIHQFNVLRPACEIGVGMGWGAYTCDKDYHFDISARYDFLFFWDQNVMREFVTTLQNHVDHIGDLQMHGLTLNVSVDF